MALKEGDQAPEFSLPDSNGNIVSLKDYIGRKVVLYFYPRDNTPGCTVEACGFRDNNSALEGMEAVVLGISMDSVKSHSSFSVKYNLPFALLSDMDTEVIQLYGAWGEKKLYGKVSMGIIRSTFLINEQGVITKVWTKVQAEGHAEEVVSAISQF